MTTLVDPASGTVLGEICHIKARSPEGPRYDPDQDEKERHAFENLVLMCPSHHKIIDDNPETYTVEKLLDIKAQHEAQHVGGAEPLDDVARQLLFQLDIHGDVILGDKVGVKIVHPPSTPPPIPCQLPPRPQHFTGRQDELTRLLAELQPGSVVTLCGPGGIGKTALAAEALHTLAEDGELSTRFPDGVVFHNFYTQPQAALALESIARAYGEEPSPSPEAAARRVLAGRQVLLVLDGAESADNLSAVLDIRGGCGVLVTTRSHRDAIAGRHDVTPLPNPKAVELLQAWGGARAADKHAAKRICELVGGLPLAVLLAGRYLAQREEDAADYLAWLEETPLAALDLGQRQHQSIPIFLDRSVAQVSDDARSGLGVVGLLALSSFPRDPVAATLDLSPAHASRLLGELVNYALLLREEARYQVSHALIHTYARERRDQLSPPSGATCRLAAHYAALAGEQTPLGPSGHAVLDAERPHIMAVLAGCLARAGQEGDEAWDAARTLAWAVDRYLDIRGHWTDRVTALEAGLTANRALNDDQQEARFLSALGSAHYRLGQWDHAIESHKRSLEIDERVGDIHGMAKTFRNLGSVYVAKGEWDRAIDFYDRSLKIDERMGDIHGMAQTFGNLASVHVAKGQWDRAIELYENTLETMERLGDIHGMAKSFDNLGSVYTRKGEWDRAIELHLESLKTKERLGDIFGMAQTYSFLGVAYYAKGDWDQAIEFYKRSLETYEQVGAIHEMAETFSNLGLVYAEKGVWDRAIDFYDRSLKIDERVGDIHGMTKTFSNLGRIYAEKGEWDRATEFVENTLETMERLGDVHGMAKSFANLGLCYRAQGDAQQAAHYVARAHRIFAALGAAPEVQQAATHLEDILGSPEAAQAYLAQFAEEES